MKKIIVHIITTTVLCILALTLVTAQSIEIDCENFDYVDDPWYIYGVETIQGELAFKNDVIVTSGSQLIVQGEVYFGAGTRLIVERNAMLTIDGGLLSGACGFWPGVELHGTSDGPQNPLYQGVVIITDGGTIENAIVGIRTCKVVGGDVVQGYSGGIIHALNAEFINNLTAIQFYPYPLASGSLFVTSFFKTDESLLEGYVPDYFVKMENVRGVKFTACEFTIEPSMPYLHSGIYAYNSLFRLEGKCSYGNDPCIIWDYGYFRNLDYGVYALYSETTTYLDIRYQDFSWNRRGVYINGAQGARVTSSLFYIPPAGAY